MNLDEERKRIIKSALTVVDELADLDIDEPDVDELYHLIKKAKELKKNLAWKL